MGEGSVGSIRLILVGSFICYCVASLTARICIIQIITASKVSTMLFKYFLPHLG